MIVVTQQMVVNEARGWLGTPYHDQASVKGEGCDCLGLLRGVWLGLYGNETEAPPPYNRMWGERNKDDILLHAVRRYCVEQPDSTYKKPGSVLVFRMHPRASCKHVAITGYNNEFIHAYELRGVVLQPFSDYWISRLAGVFALPGVDMGD